MARVLRPELSRQEGLEGGLGRQLVVQGLRRGGGPRLTHQRAEGHDAEQPLQEDAETVHERAALAAARPGHDGGGRHTRQSTARVPSGALHGGPGRGARGAASGTASLPAEAAPPSREPGARSLSPEPVSPLRGPLGAARNPTSEIAAPDWLYPAWGRACAAPALPFGGRGSGRARGRGRGSQS